MNYFTRDDVMAIRDIALWYKQDCDRKYGEVIHYDSEALERAIQQTDIALCKILNEIMAVGTTSLDLHKEQTGYVLGFADESCCVFTPPTKSFFMRKMNHDTSEEIFITNADIYDPNTEFILKLLRVLVDAHAYPCEKRLWEPAPYRVELPNSIKKQDGESQEFINSLRRLISGITDVQGSHKIVDSPFFTSFVYSVSMSNFLLEALSDSVVYGQADRYYSTEFIKGSKR
jgi:hypothetical protein